MNPIKEKILAFYEEEKADAAVSMKPTKAKVLLMALAFITATVLFTICCFQGGVYFSGIEYAGHGWLGWVLLWFTCAWTALIVCTFVLWLLGLTPLKRPRWAYFAAGATFLLLFLSGLSRHVPNPMLGEMLVGSAAALPLYLSLFVEKH